MPEYRERLWPRWWVWLLLLALVAMLAIAYGAALGAAVGWAVAALSALTAGALVAGTTPRLAVTQAGLSSGAALLPPDCIGPCRVLSAAEVRELLGPGADARVFTMLRPWSAPAAVLVEVHDPVDPHPAWLVSSRRPARVCAALGSLRTE